MKIITAKHYGLCFGVRDAIAKAESLAAAGHLTILGELVHNPIVRDRLAAKGVQEADLSSTGNSPTPQVMITAHGASDVARFAWQSAGFDIADGTCPLVRHAHHQLAALVAQGFLPVIIGKRGHVEVEGLRGDFPDALVIESEANLTDLPIAGRIGIISQTTQPIDRVQALVEAIRKARPDCEVRFVDTVCQPTKNRQNALQELIAQADTIVVVGGRNSNNTRQLAETARTAGRRVFHIERATDLEPHWFINAEIVGITAGTSTLKETVAEVEAQLHAIALDLSQQKAA